MSVAASTGLSAVRTVGGLIPADLLARILAGSDLPGLTADDYQLELGITPKEAANRSWSVLIGAWAGYRDALARLPEGDRATSLTRDKWLQVLMRELGFGHVPTTPAGGLHADGRAFPVSHLADPVPVHLLGWGVDLDTRTKGLAGAAERAPHAMVQELLNRTDAHLWAILANGSTLRMLRDSSTLVGAAYVEFDLEAIFDGELFSDFVALYLVCHRSRFEPLDADTGPRSCWLERWREDAIETGARALGDLRVGVRRTIETLGTGFLQHPENIALRAAVDAGELSLADYHRALLRLVYRLLFCFVAEDRELLLDPDAPLQARERYATWFSTARLRRVATRRRGTRHGDLWQALSLVLDGLGSEHGRPELGIAGLGGLFEHGPSDVLRGEALGNDKLLEAVRHLCVIRPEGGGPQRNVDYRHLGAEELGGIYESLLEYVPRLDQGTHAFTLELLTGNERKLTGAYYTPESLIACLLDSALDPLLDEAEAADDPDEALLALTVCDPACGSGHFLVAAARRIAHRLARVHSEGVEPTPEASQAAMHDVVGRCIYGVDVNPMAAELAKVSLWLEGLRPGRALSLLDGHIRVGNALLGATPELLAEGLPDAAFAPLEGDDKKAVTALKRRNRDERKSLAGDTLFADAGVAITPGSLGAAVAQVESLPVTSLADVHLAAQRRREVENSPALRRARFLADAWCAAFVAPKRPGEDAITEAILRRWQDMDIDAIEAEPLAETVREAARAYRFFHWHLEFPRIFDAHGQGGFSGVVGNPPWERVKLQEQEFFATREPEIAAAPNAAARKRLIRELAEREAAAGAPGAYAEFVEHKRRAEGESHLLRNSGRYPLCGRGDINTYAVFAEHGRIIIGPRGRFGVIVPTGIATDATTQHYFRDVVATRSLVSLFDFENRKGLFPSVDSRMKFCLLTLGGAEAAVERAEFAFFAHDPADLDQEQRRFELTPDEIALLNPNTGTCPVFRSRRDAEITLGIYRRVPVLVREGDPDGNPWGISFMTMFHMSNDSHLFHTRDELEADGWVLDGNIFRRGQEEMLPLYQGMMATLFDHRAADIVKSETATKRQSQPRYLTDIEKQDPFRLSMPGSWVSRDRVPDPEAPMFIGFANIAAPTNDRTFQLCPLPRAAVGNSLPLLRLEGDVGRALLFLGAASSFACDFVARQKLGGTTMNFFYVEQFPVPGPETLYEACPWAGGGLSIRQWVLPRVIELVYTAWDMAPMARAAGSPGGPFRWDRERRLACRAELDAAFLHLYGVDRDDADYVLSTFPIVNRKDRERFGEERTRRLILENYEAMALAIETGEPFVSTLDPPPGAGPRHPAREVTAA
jgi:hypothetical protein